MKTVKQLSEEMGISKQALLKKISNLPTNRQPTKVAGRYMIDSELEIHLKSIKRPDIKGMEEKTLGIKQTTDNQPTDNLVFGLLRDQIEYLKKQIDSKDEQINKIQKLLENQQILTLKYSERVKELETQKEEVIEVEAKKKWKFWKGK